MKTGYTAIQIIAHALSALKIVIILNKPPSNISAKLQWYENIKVSLTRSFYPNPH